MYFKLILECIKLTKTNPSAQKKKNKIINFQPQHLKFSKSVISCNSNNLPARGLTPRASDSQERVTSSNPKKYTSHPHLIILILFNFKKLPYKK